MCYMGIDDEVKFLELNVSSDDEFDNEFNHLSYDEVLNDFYDLHKSYKKLILKNCSLKNKISNLSKELDGFQKKRSNFNLRCM